MESRTEMRMIWWWGGGDGLLDWTTVGEEEEEEEEERLDLLENSLVYVWLNTIPEILYFFYSFPGPSLMRIYVLIIK